MFHMRSIAESRIYYMIMAGALIYGILFTGTISAQQVSTIASDNVIVMMPTKRELLGRELIAEIQRCYLFMNRSIKNRLPGKISITADWNRAESESDHRENRIIIGMKNSTSSVNERSHFFHEIARELARMGLLQLSNGAREDTEFLFEGMIEILVHEFDHSSRRLEAAWATAKLLDEMQMLGLAHQRSWTEFSGGTRSHRNAAPGITFMKVFRELQDRDRPLRFFESLRKSSLVNSLAAAFRSPAAEVEEIWLRRVREYEIPDEIIINDDEVPVLQKIELFPETAEQGASVQLRLFITSRAGSLRADNIFVQDEQSGRTIQARWSSQKETSFYFVDIPVGADRAPGSYTYTVTAIDERGNLKRWSDRYSVVSGESR
jgi:hypothetical protein